LRIIGGKYKGRKITPPSDLNARPTTDFAREGLFNILMNRVDFENLHVLDLFSGTGCISFEFASRGASTIHLVEQDFKHVSNIKRIIRDLNLNNVKPIHIDVKAFLKTCTAKYNIVFADPPYDLPWLKELPELIISANIIDQDGFFILEHPRNISFVNNECFFEHRNYGGVNFSFFRPKPYQVQQ
jgi:16S rRNA (guanine966-N2)-methyltransferase